MKKRLNREKLIYIEIKNIWKEKLYKKRVIKEMNI